MSDDLFDLTPNPSFKAKVWLSRPGKPAVGVDFKFKYMPAEEFDAWRKECFDANKDNHTFLSHFVEGWDDSKMSAPFSEEAFKTLLKSYQKSGPEIVRAYRLELYDVLAGN